MNANSVNSLFTYCQSYVLNGNFFQLLFQVITTTGAASFVSECGRGWMLNVAGAARRGRGGNRVIPVISGF